NAHTDSDHANAHTDSDHANAHTHTDSDNSDADTKVHQAIPAVDGLPLTEVSRPTASETLVTGDGFAGATGG
ncbi:MAG: hypothetical protein WAT42_11155, partial [Candidatus Nanopelagicales bacterium]